MRAVAKAINDYYHNDIEIMCLVRCLVMMTVVMIKKKTMILMMVTQLW